MPRVLLASVVSSLLLTVALAGPAAAAETKFSVVNGCWSLKGAPQPGPFRLQATTLGQYLLYTADQKYLGPDGPAAEPGTDTEWKLEEAGGENAFKVTNALTDASFTATFAKADGCAVFPEVETNVDGEPMRGGTSYGTVRGAVDAHMHHMAFEFLGGRVHCGRPWHRYGVTKALVDCVDHGPNGSGAALENTLSYGNPVGTHDPIGWPSFKDWPHPESLTHEQSYYKWLERSWRSGLRIFTNLLVENRVLCELYPLKQNSCNEMDSVRLQAKRMRELQDYIDAQSGGPGKGFYRIVKDPFEAREVINDGKLAVIMGMEISEPFNCGLKMDVPQCDQAQIDAGVEELHALGVRQLELSNKFDNALSGVAGDGGETGTVTSTGNFYATGKFFDMTKCDDPNHHDRKPTGVNTPNNTDALIGNGLEGVFQGQAPVQPDGPVCNAKGLSSLGEFAVRKLMQKRMIFDPDHMSVRGRNQALTVVESQNYPGIMSSHSWSTDDATPRIQALGGILTPYAGASKDFVSQWRKVKSSYKGAEPFALGYGADMNGFGPQGTARKGENPVTYPFKGIDSGVIVGQQRSGTRVYDINRDGVAHYGLYPDWIEDLRKQAGDEIVEDLARGSEAYLQMWERTEGIAPKTCRPGDKRFSKRGLEPMRIGDSPRALLARAGQPNTREGRPWTYCATGRGGKPGALHTVFQPDGRVGLIASTARGNQALRLEAGDSVKRLRTRTKRFGRGGAVYQGLRGNRRYVFGVKNRRISFVGITSADASRSRAALNGYLKLAGLG